MSVLPQLDDLVSRLKGLADFEEEVARVAAPMIQEAVRKRAASGVDAYGKPIAPKKDGSRALANVADNIAVRVVGGVVQIVLTGGAVFHQHAKGSSDSRPQRRVLPDAGDGVPDWIADLMRKAVEQVWRRRMGG